MIKNKFIRKILCKLLFKDIIDNPTNAYTELTKYLLDEEVITERYKDGAFDLIAKLLNGD